MRFNMLPVTAAMFLSFSLALSMPARARENPVAVLFRQAIEAYESRDYKTAIQLFEKAIQLNPKNAAAYNFVALAYKQDGAPVEKIETILNQAIKVDPGYAPPYDNLSKIYYGLGRFSDAEKYALKALERDPKLLSSLQTLGWTYLVGIQRPSLAVEYFQKTVEVQPAPYALFGLGISYIMNDEKLYALETITALRRMDQAEMAQELQRMVETENVDQALAALSPVKVEAGPAAAAIDRHDYEVKEEIPVRLRRPDSGGGQRPLPPAAGASAGPAMTPAERLRQLRQKSQGGY
jgi:tetratricopeptide (TPR) repeat protein